MPGETRCSIREGVYQLQDYPIRVTHLAYTDDVAIRQAVKIVIQGLLEQHIRHGAVPPHGMVMNWTRAESICQCGSPRMQEACRLVSRAQLGEVGNAVSNHF